MTTAIADPAETGQARRRRRPRDRDPGAPLHWPEAADHGGSPMIRTGLRVPTPPGIVAFVGHNSSGKTLALMETVVIPSLLAGRRVLANFPIFWGPEDAHLGSDGRLLHPLYEPLTSWRQLVEFDNLRNVTIVLDEITSMFDSRESGKMPPAIRAAFDQLRKDDNLIAWSAPNWDRADKTLRTVTLGLWLCTGHRPRDVEGRMWPQNRSFRYRFFDAQMFDEFGAGAYFANKPGAPSPMYRVPYRRERHVAHHLYDTYRRVNLLDHLDEYGTCIRCGGTRRRPPCKCPS